MQETVHLAAQIHCVWGDEQVGIPADLDYARGRLYAVYTMHATQKKAVP